MAQRLSARQEECLRLTAFLTDKEIAARLGLSEATVKKHVHEACRRLGVNRRKAALALLERNVPDPTKDPIAAPDVIAFAGPAVAESDDGPSNKDASPLDVGRSGSRPGRIQPVGRGRSAASPSDAGVGGRRGTGESARTSATGSERGLGHGPGGGPERRLGYRPPPGNWGVRLLIIAGLVILCALMMKAVADMVLAYAAQAQAIGHMVLPASDRS
jgi:DNA-binding CsgD family transcriptional regulator